MSGIKEAARATGVHNVQCPQCGAKFNAEPLYRRFFQGILKLLMEGDVRVNIPQFGIFTRKILKGRVHNTPVTPTGEVRFEDRFVLRFRQAAGARRSLNENTTEPNPEMSALASKGHAAAEESRAKDKAKLAKRGKR